MKKSTLNPEIRISQDGDEIPSDVNLNDESHFLRAKTDKTNGDIYLIFSSRVSMYDFARSLLYESIYGKAGQQEFYPLGSDEKLYIVDGVRLSLDSPRIFVEYPADEPDGSD
jgi:hypothetical protein